MDEIFYNEGTGSAKTLFDQFKSDYGSGTTNIMLTVTDANGNSSYSDITISVSAQTSGPIKVV